MNTSESSFPELLIARYLSNEASDAEKQELEEWIALSSENELEFNAFKKLWEKSNQDSAPRFDSVSAFRKVKVAIQESEVPVPKVIPLSGNKNRMVWRIAATLIVVLGIASIFIYLSGKEEIIRVASGEITKEVRLPDSTLVILKPHSEIAYSSNYGKSDRKTELKGEAFYDVTRNVNSPFVIQAGEAYIKVLGTSFSINSIQQNDVAIQVSTGKVLVYDGEHEQTSTDSLAVILLPGQEAHFSEAGKPIKTKSIPIENIRYSYDKTLVFENSDLKAVCELLEKIFGAKIQFKREEISNCRLTATFKNQNLTDILLIISETFNITVVKDSQSFILDGPGC